MPGLTGVVVGRPTAEDLIVLTPVGVPSISFAIKICERPDAGVAEDEEPEFSGHLRSELATARPTNLRPTTGLFLPDHAPHSAQ